MVDVEVAGVMRVDDIGANVIHTASIAFTRSSRSSRVEPIVGQSHEAGRLRSEFRGRRAGRLAQGVELTGAGRRIARGRARGGPFGDDQDLHAVAAADVSRRGATDAEDFVVGMGSDNQNNIGHMRHRDLRGVARAKLEACAIATLSRARRKQFRKS